jgi:GNAT superfamily N-acetyltransferase
MCRYWLAQDPSNEIIGQAMVTYEWSDWRDGMFWWLQSVYVVPEARGQGVFRALYQHIANLAQTDPDGRGLRLYVETENTDARSVYARLGMQSTSYLVLEDDWSEAFGANAD